MSTTIQIANETKQLLDSFKDEDRNTYDKVIQALINQKKGKINTMFGKHKNLKWNKKEDGLKFDDELHD